MFWLSWDWLLSTTSSFSFIRNNIAKGSSVVSDKDVVVWREPETYPRLTRDIPETYPKYTWGVPEMHLRCSLTSEVWVWGAVGLQLPLIGSRGCWRLEFGNYGFTRCPLPHYPVYNTFPLSHPLPGTPLSCPPDFISHPFFNPSWPTPLCPCPYSSSYHYHIIPNISSNLTLTSSNNRLVLFWFHRFYFLFQALSMSL